MHLNELCHYLFSYSRLSSYPSCVSDAHDPTLQINEHPGLGFELAYLSLHKLINIKEF